MVALSFINPLDQPTGQRRLLGELLSALKDERFNRWRFIVAFAKTGPLIRMQAVIEARRAKGLRIEAIFGVDQFGTSAQALTFALKHFDRVYITREANLTFHPKMYAFDGPENARLFIGSNNLTVGGTETNFEASVCIDAELPEEKKAVAAFDQCWTGMLPAACPATKALDATFLSELIRDGTAPDESTMRQGRKTGSTGPGSSKVLRSGLKIKPASPLPARKPLKGQGQGTRSATTGTKTVVTRALPTTADPYSAQGLIIQIKPHHNGEIFLSVTAALQNPAFFKWPFSGLTVPKKGGNVAYPQLTPDPRVNITVYGANLKPLLQLSDYGLNTVYYEKKSEIRITASPLVGVVPDYSVMIMQESDIPEIDYNITIHTPASPDFATWVGACNQSMPSGGKQPRKFGWF
jgi:HKD family nuclease